MYFNAARVRQANQNFVNTLPLHISHSSMEREQGKRWGHPNPFLWSSSWGETAHHIISCWPYSSTKGPGSYFLWLQTGGQQESSGAWAPLHTSGRELLTRFGLHKTSTQNQFCLTVQSDYLNPTGWGQTAALNCKSTCETWAPTACQHCKKQDKP